MTKPIRVRYQTIEVGDMDISMSSGPVIRSGISNGLDGPEGEEVAVGTGVGTGVAVGTGFPTTTGTAVGTGTGAAPGIGSGPGVGVGVGRKRIAVGSGVAVGTGVVTGSANPGVRITTTSRSRSIFTEAMVSLPVSTPFHAIPYPEASG